MALKPGNPPARPPSKPANKRARRRRPLLKWLLVGVGVLILAGAMGFAAVWHHLFHDMPTLPSNAELTEVMAEPAAEYRASDGTLLAIRGPRYGRFVALEDLPPHVPAAFIAAEDKNFYAHEGMDSMAIARALWANWRAGATVQGGSTITQQLVKNLVLTREQTFKRKAQEIRLAQRLEKRLTKDQILTLYLNRIYLGSQAYGIDAAARTYFAKPATELTLAEATLLAGLPKAPSRLALDVNLDGARARQSYVLDQMVEQSLISGAAAETARLQDVALAPFVPDPQFGYLVDMAAVKVDELLPSRPKDLVITLAIDPELQAQVQAAIAERMEEKGGELDASQAAALFIAPDGRILTLVGGLSYDDSQFNRVTQARRQPGSAFKTFVYAAALEGGLSPFSVRDDVPIEIDGWRPANYGRGNLGPVTLAEAYTTSLNTIAARLGQEVGTAKIADMAKRLGITSPLDPVASIALGTEEVKLIELVRAYAPFALEGRRVEPWLIARIEDTRGKVLYERQPAEGTLVLRGGLVREMNAMMLGVVLEGTGQAAAVRGWDVAGKTGTSQDWRDAWFIGFTPELIGGVWVGNDDNSPMKQVTGGGLPAEIWSEVATILLAGKTPKALPGAELSVTLAPEDEARIVFYRDLSTAFRLVEDRG